jgi:cell division protein FtsQ
MTDTTETVAADRAASPAADGGGRPERPPDRRPNRWKAAFVALLVLGVFGTAAWVVFGSRLLVVRHIEVSGTERVSHDRVVAAAGVPLGGPMIRLDTRAVADRLVVALREIESVQVRRIWPATLRIAVRERVPVVIAWRAGRYHHIDRFGVTVVDTAAPPRGLPQLVVAAPGPGDPATVAALSVWRSLPAGFRERVSVIAAPGPEAVTLRLKSGISVVWGAPERAADKIRLVEALHSPPNGQIARTIDVSAPEVVTTR